MRTTLLDEGATELALTSDQELAMWTGRQGGQQVLDTETTAEELQRSGVAFFEVKGRGSVAG